MASASPPKAGSSKDAGLCSKCREALAPLSRSEKEEAAKADAARLEAEKKKVDAGANPCHGVVYSGVCTKADCQFDHHAGRCKAFKEAHPDGPPPRR